jgi:hypothetical protein
VRPGPQRATAAISPRACTQTPHTHTQTYTHARHTRTPPPPIHMRIHIVPPLPHWHTRPITCTCPHNLPHPTPTSPPLQPPTPLQPPPPFPAHPTCILKLIAYDGTMHRHFEPGTRPAADSTTLPLSTMLFPTHDEDDPNSSTSAVAPQPRQINAHLLRSVLSPIQSPVPM